MNRIIAALMLGVSLAVIGSSGFAGDDASGEDQPSVRSASAPTLKTPDIGGTGVLDYNYELSMPKFHGIEPKLTLNYSSSRKTKIGGLYQGWLGYGWALNGFDVIERTRKNGSIPSFVDGLDVFQLNGEELVDCKNSDDAELNLGREDMAEGEVASCNATETQTVVDAKATTNDNFLRIVRDGNDLWSKWVVTNREGTKMVLKSMGNLANFGGNTVAETDVAKRSKWYVSSVTDVHGNTVDYTYWCDAKAETCYPATIEYGPTDPGKRIVVTFHREGRVEDLLFANGHTFSRLSKRIKSISVKVGTNFVTGWAFIYDNEVGENDWDRPLRLTRIKRYGSKFTVSTDGTITADAGSLPHKETKFNYANYDNFTAGADIDGFNQGFNFDVVDVDSDGRAELLQKVFNNDGGCRYRLFNMENNGNTRKLDVDNINCYPRVGKFTFYPPSSPLAQPQPKDSYPLPEFSIGHFGDDVKKTQLLFREGGALNEEIDSKVKWEAIFTKLDTGFDVKVNICGGEGVKAISDNKVKAHCGKQYPFAQVMDLEGEGRDDIRSLKWNDKEGSLGTVNLFDDGTQQQIYARSEGLKLLRRTPNGEIVVGEAMDNVFCTHKFSNNTTCMFGDINGDGTDDLVVLSSILEKHPNFENCDTYPYWDRQWTPGTTATVLCKQTIRIKAYLSTGAVNQNLIAVGSAPAIVFEGTAYTNVKGGLFLRDLDGDGRSEIIFHEPAPSPSKTYPAFENSGRPLKVLRLKRVGGEFELEVSSNEIELAPRNLEFGDINGDGMVDMLFRMPAKANGEVISPDDYYRRDFAGDPPYFHENEYNAALKAASDADLVRYKLGRSSSDTAMANLMMSIETETGATTKFDYTPSSNFNNRYLPFPVAAVTRVWVNDGRGTSNSETMTSYGYEGGDFSTSNRKFLGFKKVTKRLPAIATTTNPNNTVRPYIETTYLQDIQTVGLVDKIDYYDDWGQEQLSLRRRVNEIYNIKVKKPWRANNIKTVTGIIEGGDTVKTLRVERTYDFYKNILTETNLGLTQPGAADIVPGTSADIPGDEVMVVREFKPNTGSFTVSAPVRETTYKSATSTTAAMVLAKSETFYDNQAAVDTPPLKGLPTKVVVYRDPTPLPSVTNYTYDLYGNRRTEGVENTFVATEWLYDDDGLFMKEEKKQVSSGVWLSTKFNYTTDPVAKVCQSPVSIEGVNSAVTTYTYDDFCRLTKSEVTGGAVAYTDYLNDGNPLLQRIVTRTPLPNSSEMATVEQYYDGLGRTWQTRTLEEAPAGQSKVFSTVETLYDQRGNVSQTSLPYKDGDTKRFVTNYYDWANRVVKTSQPDGAYTTLTYTNNVPKAADAALASNTGNFLLEQVITRDYRDTSVPINSHATRSITSTYGDVVLTTRIDGPTAAAELVQAATYDGLKRLIGVKDAGGAVWSYTYDLAGNRKTVSDPDLGSWSYSYDLANRLISQTDARNIVTTLTYDGIDRVRTKTAGGVLIADNKYDGDGKITPVALDKGNLTKSANGADVTALDYSEQTFDYDANGLVTKRVTRINKIASDPAPVWDTEETIYHKLSKLVLQKKYYTGPAAVLQIAVPDGSSTFTYNLKGQLATIPGYVTGTTYELDGQTKAITYGNGVNTAFTYDLDRRWLTKIRTERPNTHATVLESTYLRNAKGQITKILGYDPDPLVTNLNVSKNTWTYNYDFRDRLDKATNGGTPTLSEDFSYAANNNMIQAVNLGNNTLSKTYSYIAGRPHAASSVSVNNVSTPITYDASGNTLSDGPRTMLWDNANRLFVSV